MKHYFFTTVQEGSRNRLHPLPYQTDDNGRGIIASLNVQASTEMRESYPIGTIFGSSQIDLSSGSGTPFYKAGDIYPVSVALNNLLSPRHRPSEDMVADYNIYMSQNGEKIAKDANANIKIEPARKPGQHLTFLDKIKMNPLYEVPTVEKDGFWVDENNWWMLVTNILDFKNAQNDEERINSMFTGPQGSGKTKIVKILCDRLGLPLSVYDMGSMHDPISELIGEHRINEKGCSEFDYARFAQDIQKEGVVLLDELSRAPSTSNNLLLPCLDERRTLYAEKADSKHARQIKIHPKCHFIATANIGAEFTGVFELDPALKSRFTFIKTTPMPAIEEIKLLVRNYAISKADATILVNTAKTIQSLHEKGEIHEPVTTRDTQIAAKKVAMGFSAKWAMEMIYLTRYEGTKAEGDAAIVYNAILSN